MNTSSDLGAGIRKANADYTVVDRTPLHLSAGELVTLGVEDKAWAGWVWVTTAEGRGTYVPASCLQPLHPPQARVLEAFEAVDLSVKKGQPVTVLQEVSGWFWCRNEGGQEGWVPDYVLSRG
jgi:uncharacterized protein YgiM (DUF1202 family)